MVEAVEVSFWGVGARLPRGEVAMAFAQPYIEFVHQESFSWTPAARSCALDCIDDTLAISRHFPNGAAKTHVNIFTKCTIPSSAAMRDPKWTTETAVIGGVGGLTKDQCSELGQKPSTTCDNAHNPSDRIHAHQWASCSVTWAKLPEEEGRSWPQPKLISDRKKGTIDV